MPASVVAGDTIRMNISSVHVITLYRNGTSFGSYDDVAGVSTLTTGGVGLGLSGTTSDSGVWAYWEGGDASGGGGGCTAPTVTVDPSNTSVYEPATANFTVTVTGTSPTYQWQRSTVNVSTGSGGTTNSYTTAATTVVSDSGAVFRVIAHNSCGDDTSANATLTVRTAPSSGLPWSDDFESFTTPDSTSWVSCANGDEFSAGLNGWTNTGKCYSGVSVNRVGRFGHAHSGTRSIQVTFSRDEDEARMRRNHINSDSVTIQMWLWFASDYDNAFGEKLFRVNAVDSTGVSGCASGSLFWDLIFYIRSATQTTGQDAMASFTGEANGGSGGAIGGGAFISANFAFPLATWFQLTTIIKLPTGTSSNGVTIIKYNDSTIASLSNINNMRTSSRNGSNGGACTYDASTDTHKIMVINPVGWYSNGGCAGVGCVPHPTPATPATKYVDDVCFGRNLTECPSTIGGGTAATIAIDPSNASKTVGQTANFSVIATGTGPITYQWQKSTTNVSVGSGGTTNSYTTASLLIGDNGNQYRCIATNAYGADTSAYATLTVTAASDCHKSRTIGHRIIRNRCND